MDAPVVNIRSEVLKRKLVPVQIRRKSASKYHERSSIITFKKSIHFQKKKGKRERISQTKKYEKRRNDLDQDIFFKVLVRPPTLRETLIKKHGHREVLKRYLECAPPYQLKPVERGEKIKSQEHFFNRLEQNWRNARHFERVWKAGKDTSNKSRGNRLRLRQSLQPRKSLRPRG